MCRTGGRRCPSHIDPLLIAKRNARRREAYASHKEGATPVISEPKFADPSEIRRLAYPSEWDVDATQFEKSLTEDEATAFKDYTDEGYIGIKILVVGDDIPWSMEYEMEESPYDEEELEHMMSNLDSGLAKAVKPDEPRDLYRGITVPMGVADEDIDNWLTEHFPVGGTFSQKNYMSTSASPVMGVSFGTPGEPLYDEDDEDIEPPLPNLARSIILEMKSKQGAILSQNLATPLNYESEVLLPRNAKLKIVGVHKEVQYSYIAGDGQVYTMQRTIVQAVDAE